MTEMKVGGDHWLEGVKRKVIAGGAAMDVRRVLVIHFTAGATGLSSIGYWNTPAARGANAHLVIERDGTVYQCRPFNRQCGHAGKSRWRDPKTGVLYHGVNACGIGIELANAGNNPALARKWSKLPLVEARHKNGGPVSQWEAFPDAQLAACAAAALALVTRYRLDDIVGHEDIAPERKNDPGPAFPMGKLRELCGFTGMPRVEWV